MFNDDGVRSQNQIQGVDSQGNLRNVRVDEEGNVMIKLAGGTDTSDATATADDILSTKTAYAKGEKLTGSMANNGALNYTPSTSSQTIPAGYTSGGTVAAVTSSVDANISAGNIKSGVSILGVEGSYSGLDTSDADATSSNIEYNKTAYVNGQKVTGSLPRQSTFMTNGFSESIGTLSEFESSGNKSLQFDKSVINMPSFIFGGNGTITGFIPYSDLATFGSITAGKIKKDETIFGITGTYEASGGSTPDYITLSSGAVLNISYMLQEKYTESTYGLEVTVTKAYSPDNSSCYFECLVYNPSYTGADVGADLMVTLEANNGMVGLVGGNIPSQNNYVIVSGSTSGPDTSILKGSSFTATAYNNS